MKLVEEIKYYKKEFVFDSYSRIIDDFKNYERISKVKMIKEIYQLYQEDIHHIIYLCTTRELKFLQKVLNHDIDSNDEEKYDWEITQLCHKFLLVTYPTIQIPEEIYEQVKIAMKKVKWKEVKKLDQINEIMVSICRIYGELLLEVLIDMSRPILNCSFEDLAHHIFDNPLFKYYVYIDETYIESLDEARPVAIYQDYYSVIEELEKQRKSQGKAGSKMIDIRDYKSLFYHDFNFNNRKIVKFYQALEKLPCFHFSLIKPIQLYALLNKDRTPLKEAIADIPILKNYDLREFFNLLDEAMDEMPSGALNGLTPNEVKKLEQEEKAYQQHRLEQYEVQTNAYLSKKDADLFYKLYFALLEFTNKKYHINPNIKKIYHQKAVDPRQLPDIMNQFWKDKEKIIEEFINTNPYKFKKEELEIIQGFTKGFRDVFIIVAYEKEYTALMNREKTYMIKGINCNIDQIIPNEKLPMMILTSILPFKNQIIYDSLLGTPEFVFGLDFAKSAEEEYEKSIKYYHL